MAGGPGQCPGWLLGDFTDQLGDLGGDRADDLGAVTQVHLVAVVLGRVVGGGYYDPGHALVVADPVRHYRGRDRLVGQQHLEALRGEDVGAVAGEVGGFVAGVVADDHPAALVAVLRQPASESGGGLGHHNPVHPGRSGAKRPA